MGSRSMRIPFYNQDIIRPVFVPGEQLANYYYIDIYGNVYSALSRQNLILYKNTKGYLLASMQTVDGKRIQERVHRLVKYTFDYFPGCETYQVDHIDGNKSNNFLGNLDWVTAKENIRRAEANGTREQGRRLSLSYDDKIAIAYMIIDGWTNEEIIKIYPTASDMKIGEILQRPEINGVPYALAQQARDVRREIIRRKNRTSVSEDQMHALCRYFEANKYPYDNPSNHVKGQYVKSAMESVGLDYNNKDQKQACLRLLHKVNNSAIYSQYNY